MDSTVRDAGDGVHVLAMPGDYDFANASNVEHSIVAAHDGEARLVIDMSETKFIDSTVLSVFVRQQRSLNGKLALLVPGDSRLRRLFEMTNLTDTLHVIDSIDAAKTLGER